MPALSRRLAAIAALVPPGLPMADIGTDHGQLPVFLVRVGQVPLAIGVDAREPPLVEARRYVARELPADLQRRVELRRGWGCAALGPGEVHTLTLAGMGGPTMVRILGAARGVQRLVLQPNVGEAGLRTWLFRNGWDIDQERVVRDAGRWFDVFAAGRRHGDPSPPDAVDLAYGVVAHHLDREALALRLDDDEARLAPIAAKQQTERGRRSLKDQLDWVASARTRLGFP